MRRSLGVPTLQAGLTAEITGVPAKVIPDKVHVKECGCIRLTCDRHAYKGCER